MRDQEQLIVSVLAQGHLFAFNISMSPPVSKLDQNSFLSLNC